MLTAFEKSNAGFKFIDDVIAFKRIVFGLVLGFEEFIGADGSTKESLIVRDFLSGDEIRQGKFTVPELKRLNDNNGSDAFAADEEDDDLPFN